MGETATAYDVFLSYSHEDREWVRGWLLPHLEAANLRVCIDYRNFIVGLPSLVNMENAAKQSRHTLLVLTPAWVQSEWTDFEALLNQTRDPAGQRRRTLPLLLRHCDPPDRIAMLTYADFTNAGEREAQLQHLLASIRSEPQPSAAAPRSQRLLAAERSRDPAQRNRLRMLAKVRDFWIKGVLENSLHGTALLALGLEARPDAVAHPFDLIVERPDRAPHPLRPGMRIAEVFDDLAGELLILGAPGGGKTTLLLELARELLDRADLDEAHPIPAVFNLSTWATQHPPLAEWLTTELNQRYDVPQKIAQAWVDAEAVLPLLDGLDEVQPTQRAACVEAINAYHREHGTSLVVCSRIADYKLLASKLRLRGAILIQPLTNAQIDMYLASASDQLVGLRTAIHHDAALHELAETPLLLSVMTLAYQGAPQVAVESSGSLDVWRDHLFAAYVARMLDRPRSGVRYTRVQTLRWLIWLAQIIRHHAQSVFLIERMQPRWLRERTDRWCYFLLVALLIGLIAGLPGGLIGRSHGIGLLVGLAVGLAVSIPMVSRIGSIDVVETLRWSWANAIKGAGLGVAAGLIGGFIGWHSGGLAGLLLFGWGLGLFGGIVNGIFLGLTGSEIRLRTRPNQGIWRSAQNALLTWLSVGTVLGVGLAGFGILVDALVGPHDFGVAFWMFRFGLPLGILFLAPPLGLARGGLVCTQHLVLRILLWRSGVAPWNYARFLDHCADRILLRKVGGGYIFIHRMLMDYFASLKPDDISLTGTAPASPLLRAGEGLGVRVGADDQDEH